MNLSLTLFQNPLLQTLGWALIHFLWQGLAVALVLAITLYLLRERGANARYLSACTALALMACLPVATVMVLRAAHKTPAVASPAFSLAVGSDTLRPKVVGSGSVNALSQGISNGQRPIGVSLNPAATDLDRFIPWLVALWLVGVGFLSLRLLGGWLITHRLIRTGSAPENEWLLQRAHALAERMQIHRRVEILVSPHIAVPSVMGCLKSVILIPSGALIGLAPDQLEALVAHELAHVRRYDYLVNLLQTAIETLLFYHPAVWWVSRRIQIERENCCDDLAIEAMGDRLVYARALTSMEELRMAKSTLPSHVMAANGAPLAARIRRILGLPTQLPAHRVSPGWTAGTLLLAVTLTAVVAVAIKAAPDGKAPDQKSAAKTKQAVTSKRLDSDDSIKIEVKDGVNPKPVTQAFKAVKSVLRTAAAKPVLVALLQDSQEDQQKLAELKAKEAAQNQKEEAELAELRAKDQAQVLKERSKLDEIKAKQNKQDLERLLELQARGKDLVYNEKLKVYELKDRRGADTTKDLQRLLELKAKGNSDTLQDLKMLNELKAKLGTDNPQDLARLQDLRAKRNADSVGGAQRLEELLAKRTPASAADAKRLEELLAGSADIHRYADSLKLLQGSSDDVRALRRTSDQTRKLEMELRDQIANLKAQQEAIRRENADLKAKLLEYMRLRDKKEGRGSGANKRSQDLLNYSQSQETDSLLLRRENLLQQLDESKLKYSDSFPLMNKLKNQIDGLTAQIPNTPQTAKASAEGILLRKNKLQGDLDEARLLFKEQHPRIQELQKQIDEFTMQMPNTPQIGKAGNKTNRIQARQSVAVLEQLQKEEDRLQQLQLEYKDSTPEIVSVKRRIVALKKQLGELKGSGGAK
jgi:beta-lactamase regulating signal transducer with metallopeptidase domain